MNALVEDGVITLTEDEQLARTFQRTFGLSESAATRAAEGRDGPSRKPASGPVSEAQQTLAAAIAAELEERKRRLIGIIEQWAQDLLAHGPLCVEHGDTREQAALQEAFSKVFLSARSDSESAWILGVAYARWPELSCRRSARSGGVSETTKPSPSRSTTVAEFVTDRQQSTLRRGSRG